MGQSFGKLRKRIFGETQQKVLMLGIGGAGKTTILHFLKYGKFDISDSIIIYNIEGGSEKIRPLWRHYFVNTNAVIFVVDSSERERLEEAKTELF